MERKVNPHALHQYLTHCYISGEHTILEGIRRLPPAHLLVVRGQQVKLQRYWRLVFAPSTAAADEEEAAEHLEKVLEDSVKRRLMSDVPLGAFLSGGLDSSTIVALMARFSDRPVRTFTVGFEETGYSELEDARVVARSLGTEHQEMMVKPSAMDILPDLVWYLDEPFGDSSAIPTYYVCKAARQHVTVALSGDGGDEVFAGYRRYLEIERYRGMARIPGWVRGGVLRPLAQAIPITWPGRNYMHALAEADDDGIAHRLGIFPYIRDALYTEDFLKVIGSYDPFEETEQFLAESHHLDPVSKYQYLDTHQYLPGDILTKVDRMSMANSLEVRAPLLDVDLVEYMATLPLSCKLRGGVTKYLLRKVAGKLLPSSVLEKPKQGFAIPKGRWFQNELRSSAEEILLDPRTLSRGYFREDTIHRMLAHHASGRRDYSDWIWCLIVLEMWFRIFLDDGGESR
jgi:asparagine synthase (glutamine-hydrolysing)